MATEPMTREKLSEAISSEIDNLRDFTDLMTKLLGNLQSTLGRDVTFVTLEETKTALESLPRIKCSISKTRTALKARMAQRTKEV